jgi:uncharacterized protein with HEPN domain
MSAKTDADFLRDMLEHAQHAVSFAQGRSPADLDADDEFCFALQHCIMIIGEAASKVSESTKARLPTIAWHEIIGMRQWIVHRYDRVDNSILWKTVAEDIPELIEQILQFLPPE